CPAPCLEPFSPPPSRPRCGCRISSLRLRISAEIIAVLPVVVTLPTPQLGATYVWKPVVLTEDQELNPPALPPVTLRSACKAQIRRISFSKRRSSPPPRPIDPKSLETADIPATVYTSPIALPLPKGPAPAPIVAPKRRRWSLSGPSSAELHPTLCPGW
ncbi:hypothetical protein C8J57DRAFT_1475968, partial [Mycena rebaudengoi]